MRKIIYGVYSATTDGDILKNGEPMKGCFDKDGYRIVNFLGKRRKVHRLVAIAFIPNPKNLPQVNHKNGVKDDNRVANLEWVCNGTSQRHALRNSIKPAKILPSDVGLIRESALTLNELAAKYKVAVATISRIKNGKRWGWL